MQIEDLVRSHFPSTQFSFSEEDLSRLGYSLSGSYVKPAGIFYPQSKGDVVKIVKLLAKRPEDRFQTATEYLKELERIGKFSGASA